MLVLLIAKDQEPTFLERWFSEGSDVRNNHDVSE
jgi:hypothetical protein